MLVLLLSILAEAQAKKCSTSQCAARCDTSMLMGMNGAAAVPIFTIGQTFNKTSGRFNKFYKGKYTPPGILDGLGAIRLRKKKVVRVFALHELLNFRGYPYKIKDGKGGFFTLKGARISHFDIDPKTAKVVDAGLAYDTIYDANGNIASDASFLSNNFQGFSRFCSATLERKNAFGRRRGLRDDIFFAGEEDGGRFNPVGGAMWALDIKKGNMWQVPAMGRGAWENIVQVDTGDRKTVAFILSDDTSPFDFDRDNATEAAPLYMYMGTKNTSKKADFLSRNGLKGGTLHVWVPNKETDLSPLQFRISGMRMGKWIPVDNIPRPSLASENGNTSYDEYGYPTQSNLWIQAEGLKAFGFSRPEDLARNPRRARANEVIVASTGVDTYAIDPVSGNGADTFGTLYSVKTFFRRDLKAKVTIVYDGDADPARRLRSPDNLDWARNGKLYVQEDEAEEDTLTGEPLFNEGAVNTNEAGIVEVDPHEGSIRRIANIRRDIILDFTIPDPTKAVDQDAGKPGEWESSGVIDVSREFGIKKDEGLLLLVDVQAHGIEDQVPPSRINDADLVEGGQLSLVRLYPGDDKYGKCKHPLTCVQACMELCDGRARDERGDDDDEYDDDYDVFGDGDDDDMDD
ncbi:hypothetical protein AAMO2058_000247600 [Amorphochlora amoebiformis]